MDNSFEQEFMNNVENAARSNTSTASTGTVVGSDPGGTVNNASGAGADSGKGFKIATIVLGILVIIEAVAIGFMIMNHVGVSQNSDYATEDEESEGEEENGKTTVADLSKYVFNEEGDLTALELVCTQENGTAVTFLKDNSYSSDELGSGTYSILRDSIVPLNDDQGNSHVLYYNGFMVADGTTIYECEVPAPITEDTEEEPESELDTDEELEELDEEE